jgi:hypothetical protein
MMRSKAIDPLCVFSSRKLDLKFWIVMTWGIIHLPSVVVRDSIDSRLHTTGTLAR